MVSDGTTLDFGCLASPSGKGYTFFNRRQVRAPKADISWVYDDGGKSSCSVLVPEVGRKSSDIVFTIRGESEVQVTVED
jgi:hypothetical protein